MSDAEQPRPESDPLQKAMQHIEDVGRALSSSESNDANAATPSDPHSEHHPSAARLEDSHPTVNVRELFRMARETTSILDLQRLLDVLLDHFMEITEAQRGFIMLDWQKQSIEASRGFDEKPLRGNDLAISHSILRDVAQSGRSIFVTDTMLQSSYGSRESISALSLRSFSCVPMVHDGVVRGLCYTDSPRPGRRLAVSERDLLEAFADQAAVAIVNAHRHARLKADKVRLETENRSLREQVRHHYSYDAILGKSDAMRQVFETLKRLESSSATVLIHGETGTGKELVAQAIHQHGPRQSGALVVVNCGAIAANLVESELFGHVRGAYTDAHQERSGRIVAADAGTLLLDEVGELPMEAQVKLLRVLQEGEVSPVGSDTIQHVDVRVVAATHRDLEKDVSEGRFREDLFYRLHVIPIHLPPLRERGTDVLLLAERFIEDLAKQTGTEVLGLDADARRWMLQYAWPGNVRQLQNALERAVTLCEPGRPLEAHLFSDFLGGVSPAGTRGGPLRKILEGVEAAEVQKALQESDNVVSRAAGRLGVSRQHLHNLIKKHGLRVQRTRPAGKRRL